MLSFERELPAPQQAQSEKAPDSFKEVLRYANKVLNAWVQVTLPQTAQAILPSKKKLHELKWQKYDALSAKLMSFQQKYANLQALRQQPKRESAPTAEVNTTNIDRSLVLISEMMSKMSLQEQERHPLSPNTDAISAVIDNVGYFEAIVDLLFDLYPVAENIVQGVLTPSYVRKIETKIQHATQVKDAILASDIAFSLPDSYFRLYLYDEDRNDDDIPLDLGALASTQKEVLRQLKNHLNHAKEADLVQLNKTINLMLKFSSIFILSQAEKVKLDYGLIEKWAKVGLWLLQVKIPCTRKNRLHHQEIKQFEKSLKLVGPLVAQIYALLAYRTVENEGISDLDLFLAESYLDTASTVSQEHPLTLDEKTDFSLLCLCVQAKIAFVNQHNDAFFELVEMLRAKPSYSPAVIHVLSLAAHKMAADQNAYKAYLYSATALRVMQSNLEASNSHFDKAFLDKLKNLYAEQVACLDQDLKQKIEHQIDAASVEKVNKSWQVILTFEKIPNKVKQVVSQVESCIKVLQVADNQIKCELCSKNAEQILKALRALRAGIDQELKKEINRVTEKQERAAAISASVPSHTHDVEIVLPVQASKALSTPALQASASISHDNGARKAKSKARKESSDPQPPRPLTVATPRELLVQDFGFTEFANKPVTPIYSSKQAQAKQQTKVFLAFDKMDGIDETTESLFKSLLNPHPQGLVTTRMLAKEGAKMWCHPDNLGDKWQLAGLRLKLLGKRGGWARAIANPVQKITIKTPENKEESRYLFTIGRLVRK